MSNKRRAGGPVALLAAILLLASAPVGLQARDQSADSALTPTARYQALFDEHDAAMKAFRLASLMAKTEADKQKAYEEKYPEAGVFAPRFLQIAKDAPDDPAAIDALVWIASNASEEKEAGEAFEILARDHIGSNKLEGLVEGLAYSRAPSVERFLRMVSEKSPHRDVQGKALLSLAVNLKGRAERNSGASSGAKLSDIEAMFERMGEEFGDVEASRGSIGEVAEAYLFEMRNLSIGKTAPQIAGEDIDGVAFTLTDYRGQVVVLDFWGDW